jgi:hypothetical protein
MPASSLRNCVTALPLNIVAGAWTWGLPNILWVSRAWTRCPLLETGEWPYKPDGVHVATTGRLMLPKNASSGL